MRQLIFNLTIQGVGRGLLLRDIVFGWASVNWRIDPNQSGPNDPRVSRHSIPSGHHTLDGVLVTPASSPPLASVLICHGIGETVQRWHSVQRLLAAKGVA